MSVFYDREETDREVIVRYKPHWLYALLVLLIPLWGQTLWPEQAFVVVVTPIAMFGLIALVLGRFIAMRAVRKEIVTAMRVSEVVVRGSRFNPKDPITVRIPKEGQVSSAKPRGV